MRKCVQLPLHSILVVQKPPASAELNLSGNGVVLEIARRGSEDVIVCRVAVVKDHPRQSVLLCEQAEIGGECRGLLEVSDRIKTGVRTELSRLSRVRAAQGPDMELHRPAALRIETSQI